MFDNQLFSLSTDVSLFDTYLVYGIIGLLIFTALIGLIILLITSYCCLYCYFYPSSYYLCCCQRHRHSSYKLNKKLQEDKEEKGNPKKIFFIKRHSSDITDFTQLYNSCPQLLNNTSQIPTSVNNVKLNTSCTTINTLVSPISPCSSFIESGLPIVHNDLGQNSQVNIHKIDMTKDAGLRPLIHISHRPPSYGYPISPRVISLEVTRISAADIDNNIQRHSPCTNIYETVVPITTNLESSMGRSTPIYETDWTHNINQLIINQMSSVELPSLPSSDLMPSIHYFQHQYPYDKFLANRKRTSDSMRRTKMLKRLKDDAAFLY